MLKFTDEINVPVLLDQEILLKDFLSKERYRLLLVDGIFVVIMDKMFVNGDKESGVRGFLQEEQAYMFLDDLGVKFDYELAPRVREQEDPDDSFYWARTFITKEEYLAQTNLCPNHLDCEDKRSTNYFMCHMTQQEFEELKLKNKND